MKTAGMKVLVIGLLVLSFSAILNLYLDWLYFDMYVIKKSYWNLERLKAIATFALFTQVFSVIGIIIVVIGVLMLLKVTQKQVESKLGQ